MFNPAHLFWQGSFPVQFHFFIPRPCPLLPWSHPSLPRPHPSMPMSHPHCSGHTHSCPGPAYLALASPTLHSPAHFWLGPIHYNLDPTSPAQAPPIHGEHPLLFKPCPSMPGPPPCSTYPSHGHSHSCPGRAYPVLATHILPSPAHHNLDPPSPARLCQSMPRLHPHCSGHTHSCSCPSCQGFHRIPPTAMATPIPAQSLPTSGLATPTMPWTHLALPRLCPSMPRTHPHSSSHTHYCSNSPPSMPRPAPGPTYPSHGHIHSCPDPPILSWTCTYYSGSTHPSTGPTRTWLGPAHQA